MPTSGQNVAVVGRTRFAIPQTAAAAAKRAAPPPQSSVQPRKPIRAPVFAADAVVDEEEAGGIVFVLDRAEPRIIFAPKGVLPIRLEEVGFPDIGADAGQKLADFVHSPVGGLSLALRDRRVRLMSGNAGIGGLLEGAADYEREGVDHRGGPRRLPGCGDRFRGPASPRGHPAGQAPGRPLKS